MRKVNQTSSFKMQYHTHAMTMVHTVKWGINFTCQCCFCLYFDCVSIHFSVGVNYPYGQLAENRKNRFPARNTIICN